MDWVHITLTGLFAAIANALIFGVWKPWAKGYSELSGQLTAREERLEQIVHEAGAIAEKVKAIESKFSGDLWDRQMRWNQKRDIYGTMIGSLDNIASAHGMMRELQKELNDKGLSSIKRQRFDEEFMKQMTELRIATTGFLGAVNLARIFASSGCVSLLDTYLADRSAATPSQPSWSVDFLNTECVRAAVLSAALVRGAKTDLNPE